MRLQPKTFWLAGVLILGCIAVMAFQPPTLSQLVKEADVIVAGKLEITREKGLVVTWYPEMKGQEMQTTHFDIGRIRVSKTLYKRCDIPYGPGPYPVAFDSSLKLTNGTPGVWLLNWNGLVGRCSVSQIFPNSPISEIEKSIAEIEKEQVNK